MIDHNDIKKAYKRIEPYIINTPLLKSNLLNQALGHNIFFKIEALQKTGSYKARGALNSIILLQEQNILENNIVAYSSGNHAQALGYAGSLYGIKPKIFMPSYTSIVKQRSAIQYGSEIILTSSREEAEQSVIDAVKNGSYNIHPSSNDMVIAGNGTIIFETRRQINDIPDAIFAACGGGGLLSGSLIAAKEWSSSIEVWGGEPENANDASKSLKENKIFKFDKSPSTIADGARTLSIAEKNFEYLKQISGIYEISEKEILYWTAWIMNLLKITCEPTSALAMGAANRWLLEQSSKKNVIVIISGGNIDQLSYNQIWKKNYLENFPSKDYMRNNLIEN